MLRALVQNNPSFILAALAAVLVVTSTSCERTPKWQDPGPRDVFDTFLMHWFRGEAELAFDYILPEDREVLAESVEQAQDLDPDRRPEPHEMLVVAAVENVYDIARMEVVEPLDDAPADGERVTVKLHHQDGTSADAHLVWSEGRWYVDLPLEEASPNSAES